ncbi:hypothetical protein M378DRAFT_1064442 [Amanita muscaria Koide BX008]|uniref:Uncharacterized protein n=1 Tax=Amanita muscaria (strain Koide BX008) TaxID=946122 RepID=A0A0C2WV86_AMAMK|nr:hypothetical protein M378DRAFT_1064442 [Amanita muscaria Koide BX008]
MVLTPNSTGTGFLDSLPSSPAGTNSSSSPSFGQGLGFGQSQGQGISGEGTSPGIGHAKRRPTAVYPTTTKTLKPFSRSAAKRESVLALGSIEHLQHYFTKTGLIAKKAPLDKPHHGLVPAIGGAAFFSASSPTLPSPSSSSPSNPSPELPEFILPPSPDTPLPRRPSYPPNQPKTYETDPDTLLPGVIDDLESVARAWDIDDDDLDREEGEDGVIHGNQRPIVTVSRSGSGNRNGTVDILELLKTTTRAIRSTRNYLVSLPDDSVVSPVTARPQFRPMALGPTTARGRKGGEKDKGTQHHHQYRHRNSEEFQNKEKDGGGGSHWNEKETTIALVRKSALEVLAALREVEERFRLPLSDDAYDALSDGSGARTQSPIPCESELEHQFHEGDLSNTSISYSMVPVQVGDRLEHVPVWEDEESSDNDFFDEKQGKKKELWDEMLVVGSGWLYRQDVRMENMKKEKGVVRSYLDVVDKAIFGEERGGRKERAWERERRRIEKRSRSKGRSEDQGVSVVAEEPTLEESENAADDEELPDWAKRQTFAGDDFGRAHAFVSAFLPSHLASLLGPANSRTEFLTSLTSGQLLCVAYNACVRKSKKPWGYVSKDSIHDIVALERAEAEEPSAEGRRKGWTFRRTDNLRLWVGALKLRYMLSIQTPSQPLTESSHNTLKLLGQLQSTVSGTNLRAQMKNLTLGQRSRRATPSAGTSPISPASQTFSTLAQAATPGYTPLTSPTKAWFSSSSDEPPIEFDARLVARMDDGWDGMLEKVLMKWMWRAVEEKRSLC